MNTPKKATKKDSQNSEVTIVGITEEAAPKATDLPKRIQPAMTFEAWWMLAQSTYKLAPHMKSAVYKHFKARGFLVSKEYDKGLRDFGC